MLTTNQNPLWSTFLLPSNRFTWFGITILDNRRHSENEYTPWRVSTLGTGKIALFHSWQHFFPKWDTECEDLRLFALEILKNCTWLPGTPDVSLWTGFDIEVRVDHFLGILNNQRLSIGRNGCCYRIICSYVQVNTGALPTLPPDDLIRSQITMESIFANSDRSVHVIYLVVSILNNFTQSRRKILYPCLLASVLFHHQPLPQSSHEQHL